MKTPRDLSGSELAKALRKLGYVVTRQSGSHLRITTQDGGEHHERPQSETALGQDRSGEYAGRSSRRDDAWAAVGRVGPERRQAGRVQAGRGNRGLGSWSGWGEVAHNWLIPGGRAVGVGRERDLDAAAAFRVRDRDGAPVQLGDPAGDRQAETCAAAVACARGEPFEHRAPVGSSDTRPLVGNG